MLIKFIKLVQVPYTRTAGLPRLDVVVEEGTAASEGRPGRMAAAGGGGRRRRAEEGRPRRAGRGGRFAAAGGGGGDAGEAARRRRPAVGSGGRRRRRRHGRFGQPDGVVGGSARAGRSLAKMGSWGKKKGAGS